MLVLYFSRYKSLVFVFSALPVTLIFAVANHETYR